jgi:hypothetical protein
VLCRRQSFQRIRSVDDPRPIGQTNRWCLSRTQLASALPPLPLPRSLADNLHCPCKSCNPFCRPTLERTEVQVPSFRSKVCVGEEWWRQVDGPVLVSMTVMIEVQIQRIKPLRSTFIFDLSLFSLPRCLSIPERRDRPFLPFARHQSQERGREFVRISPDQLVVPIAMVCAPAVPWTWATLSYSNN